MRAALVVALLCLGATTAGAADTSLPLPAGLAAVWRVDGRKLDLHDSAWSLAAFSPDGSIVGISDDAGTRLYRARDGVLVRVLPPPFAVGQYAFSLAISAAGAVALGRVGSVDLYPSMEARDPQRYYCAGSCGPVSAATFSPDGRWLAFQAAHGTQEITPGLVTVVDLRGDAEPRSLEASATRTRVSFARDGNLLAANVLRVDDAGSVGLRAWSSASWRRVRDVPGALMPRGAVGPFALNDRVAVYQRDGRMELREMAGGALVWATPLVPALESAGGDMKLELVAFSGDGELTCRTKRPRYASSPARSCCAARAMAASPRCTMWHA